MVEIDDVSVTVSLYTIITAKIIAFCLRIQSSNATSKNVSWPHFSWPTLYLIYTCKLKCANCSYDVNSTESGNVISTLPTLSEISNSAQWPLLISRVHSH